MQIRKKKKPSQLAYDTTAHQKTDLDFDGLGRLISQTISYKKRLVDRIGRQGYWASTFRSERAVFLPDESRSERNIEVQYSCLPIMSTNRVTFNQFSTESVRTSDKDGKGMVEKCLTLSGASIVSDSVRNGFFQMAILICWHSNDFPLCMPVLHLISALKVTSLTVIVVTSIFSLSCI